MEVGPMFRRLEKPLGRWFSEASIMGWTFNTVQYYSDSGWLHLEKICFLGFLWSCIFVINKSDMLFDSFLDHAIYRAVVKGFFIHRMLIQPGTCTSSRRLGFPCRLYRTMPSFLRLESWVFFLMICGAKSAGEVETFWTCKGGNFLTETCGFT